MKKHYFAAACWLALIPLTLLWDWAFAPLNTGKWLLLMKLIPLCLPIRGIVSGRIYTYQYCSMLILLPFTEGIMRLWDTSALSVGFAAAQVGLSVAFFVLCLVYLKQFKRPKNPV